MISRTLRGVAAGLVTLALLASCGDDDDKDTTTATQDDSEDTTADEGEESEDTDAGEETEDTEAPDETEAPEDEGDEPSDVPVGAGDGCLAVTSGEIEVEWTAPDDNSAVSYGAWVPEDIREMLGLDETSLILNCSGEAEFSVSFLGGGEGRPPIPMEPATYVIPGDQGVLGSEGQAMTALVTLEAGKAHGMAADGNLTIVTFTDEVIEGTFELTVSEMFVDGGGTTTVTGSFSYTNQN